MNKCLSIRKFLAAYDAGEFDKGDFDAMVRAGWHDWFCGNDRLKSELDELVKQIRTLIPSDKIDLDNHCAWFMNCCPADGDLYNRIHISEISDDGKCLWCIVPENRHTGKKGQTEIWDIAAMKSDLAGEPIITGDWSDAIKFFRK
jgi:hypothetical protein